MPAMAASEVIQELIRAHVAGDSDRFRTIALQLAASEARVGHRLVAGRIRDLVEEDKQRTQPRLAPPTPLARPARDLRGLLVTSYPKERLRDIVLAPSTRRVLERVLEEHRSRGKLSEHGLTPRRKMLFYGPPGCGKTLAASVVAGELALPLVRIRVETIFSRYLGETATLLAEIFQEMERVRGVYLFDEFDAIARRRGDQHDVGEAKRIVSTFLQLLDSDTSDSLVAAATNVTEQIDRAVFRRFDDVAEFALPDEHQIAQLLTMRTAASGLPKTAVPQLARLADGLSFADVARSVDDARKSMVLSGRKRLRFEDVSATLEDVAARPIAE
jgi:SpoVK/Ycf46/Vps4 family AAA+-type ATPase